MTELTAPEEIWLQLGFGDEDEHTWCDHDTGWEPSVKYIRAASPSEWQPAYAAPIQQNVLLLDTDGNVRIGRKIVHECFMSDLDFGNCTSNFMYPNDNMPTHFMPLPEPPNNHNREGA